MAVNIKINDTAYNGVSTIKVPLADDSGENASFSLLEPIANNITSSKVRSGYSGYDDNGNLVEGTIQDYLGSTDITANGTIPLAGKYCPSDIMVAVAGTAGCPMYQTEIEVSSPTTIPFEITHNLNSKKLIWFASLDFTKPHTPAKYSCTFQIGITPDAWLYNGNLTMLDGTTSFNPRSGFTTKQTGGFVTDWGADGATTLRNSTLQMIPDGNYQAVTYDSLKISTGQALTAGTWRIVLIDISGTNASY